MPAYEKYSELKAAGLVKVVALFGKPHWVQRSATGEVVEIVQLRRADLLSERDEAQRVIQQQRTRLASLNELAQDAQNAAEA